jgi:hypothetical protein
MVPKKHEPKLAQAWKAKTSYYLIRTLKAKGAVEAHLASLIVTAQRGATADGLRQDDCHWD